MNLYFYLILALPIMLIISFFGQSYAQVTWNTFEEKDSLFSIQIPSNWNEEEIPEEEKLAPIDYLFRYADKGDSFAWMEIMISKPSFSNATATLESYMSEYQQFDDFNLIKPIECNTHTLNDASACSFLSSRQLEGEQTRNVLNVISVSPEDIQTDVVFITSDNIYDAFSPVGDYMINSIKINSTKVNQVLNNQTIPNIQSEIPPIPLQNATTQQLQSEIPPIPTENINSSNQTFRSTHDTFVTSEPLGFGVYDEKISNIFRSGEDIILYIEPAGFEYGIGSGEGNNTLYTINFSADFTISDTKGNVLTGQEGLPVSEIISHHQNKEVFIPFTITQTTPFPPGSYIITYTIHDANSGKSFDIVKEIIVSESQMA
ncbi:MAG TPA: hypothetical protein VD815_02885 [Candidatus Saccharimonadales bacterium]|nr:hypothetical protein [Candidatus Saccharimonadales bacterium]